MQTTNKNLNGLFIRNVRRSGPIVETYTLEVAYTTSVEQLNALRSYMLEFLSTERRDFFTEFDVNIEGQEIFPGPCLPLTELGSIVDYESQDKLVISADIRYKSNWCAPYFLMSCSTEFTMSPAAQAKQCSQMYVFSGPSTRGRLAEHERFQCSAATNGFWACVGRC